MRGKMQAKWAGRTGWGGQVCLKERRSGGADTDKPHALITGIQGIAVKDGEEKQGKFHRQNKKNENERTWNSPS